MGFYYVYQTGSNANWIKLQASTIDEAYEEVTRNCLQANENVDLYNGAPFPSVRDRVLRGTRMPSLSRIVQSIDEMGFDYEALYRANESRILSEHQAEEKRNKIQNFLATCRNLEREGLLNEAQSRYAESRPQQAQARPAGRTFEEIFGEAGVRPAGIFVGEAVPVSNTSDSSDA